LAIIDIKVGDVLVMKKEHPCGSNEFDVLRTGMDLKIRCKKCGREIMAQRRKIEKNIKKVVRSGDGEENA